MSYIEIQNNLHTIKQRIADYEQKYARTPGSVQLLAASKSQSIDSIIAAFDAGQQSFGENYLQEALAKIAALQDKKIEWHFIGHIQSNKTRSIAEHFAWVHSVDSSKIAKRLNDQRPAQLPPLNICIEVNISEAETKSGIAANQVLALAQYCQTLPRCHLRGLMAIPTAHTSFNEQRDDCHKLFSLWQSLQAQHIALDTLSLGMSDDLEAAIAEGSTLVRVGTAIFGKRVEKKE